MPSGPAMPCWDTERPRRTAISRRRTLCAAEPVACWSRLPNEAGRRHGQLRPDARVGLDRRPPRRRPRAPAPPTAARARASSRAFGGSAVPTRSMSCADSRPRRRLPAISTRDPGTAARSSSASSSATGRARPSATRPSSGSASAARASPSAMRVAGAGPDAGDAAQAVLGERGGQVVEVVDAERGPERRGALGADAVDAGDGRQALGDAVAGLLEGRDLAGLGQLDDLGLEGPADVREVRGPPLEGELATDSLVARTRAAPRRYASTRWRTAPSISSRSPSSWRRSAIAALVGSSPGTPGSLRPAGPSDPRRPRRRRSQGGGDLRGRLGIGDAPPAARPGRTPRPGARRCPADRGRRRPHGSRAAERRGGARSGRLVSCPTFGRGCDRSPAIP